MRDRWLIFQEAIVILGGERAIAVCFFVGGDRDFGFERGDRSLIFCEEAIVILGGERAIAVCFFVEWRS